MKTLKFLFKRIVLCFFNVYVCVNVHVCEGTDGVQKRWPIMLVSTYIQHCLGLDRLGLPF